jgi:predicted GIY-YIG superfamily endonuclease
MAVNVDWGAIEALYCSGKRSVNGLAKEHGLAEGTIRHRVKRDGWKRPFAAYIRESHAAPKPKVVLEEEPQDKPGFVYVIYVEDTAGERFYKIGLSENFNQRIAKHQCGCQFEICVATVYYVADMQLEERALHAVFKHKRVRGEWFRLDAGDLAEIAARTLLV